MFSNLQNVFMQYLLLHTSFLFPMDLNEDIADIEKLDGILSPAFVVDDFQDYFYIHQSFLSKIQDLYK